MNEKELIIRAKNGDTSAFEELYNSCFDSLYKFVRYKISSNEVAEDISAEAFVRAFENIAKFKGESTFKSYVYSIAYNLVIDEYRKNKRTVVLDERYLNIAEIEEDNGEKSMLDCKYKIEEIIGILKGNERAVIELRFISGFSVKEVANALELSEANVKVITHRALQKCRSLFSKTK